MRMSLCFVSRSGRKSRLQRSLHPKTTSYQRVVEVCKCMFMCFRATLAVRSLSVAETIELLQRKVPTFACLGLSVALKPGTRKSKVGSQRLQRHNKGYISWAAQTTEKENGHQNPLPKSWIAVPFCQTDSRELELHQMCLCPGGSQICGMLWGFCIFNFHEVLNAEELENAQPYQHLTLSSSYN